MAVDTRSSANGNERNLALVGFCGAMSQDRDLRGGAFGGKDERAAGRRARFAQDDRNSRVAPLAYGLINRQPSEERNVELLRKLLAAPVPEDVDLVMTIRAGVVTHVLHQSDRRDVQLLVHPNRANGVGKRHLLWRRDDD